jgi:hypothetical protein
MAWIKNHIEIESVSLLRRIEGMKTKSSEKK